MPIFARKNKSGNLSCNFQSLPFYFNIPAGIQLSVTQNDANQQIEIVRRMDKKTIAILPYSQIVAFDVVTRNQLYAANQVVKGQMIFGDLSTIIAGMPDAKSRSGEDKYFVINFHPSSAPQEVKEVAFVIVGATLHLADFIVALREKVSGGEPVFL